MCTYMERVALLDPGIGGDESRGGMAALGVGGVAVVGVSGTSFDVVPGV